MGTHATCDELHRLEVVVEYELTTSDSAVDVGRGSDGDRCHPSQSLNLDEPGRPSIIAPISRAPKGRHLFSLGREPQVPSQPKNYQPRRGDRLGP